MRVQGVQRKMGKQENEVIPVQHCVWVCVSELTCPHLNTLTLA